MVATISELPMPLRKIPVCSGPQKYKGLPITEVMSSIVDYVVVIYQ